MGVLIIIMNDNKSRQVKTKVNPTAAWFTNSLIGPIQIWLDKLRIHPEALSGADNTITFY